MFIDSHCHLNYLDDTDAALDNAATAGVSGMLCIGVEEATIEDVLRIAAHHDNVWASVGQHPGATSADAGWIEAYYQRDSVVALGEMGLDYFHESDAQERKRQRHTFAQQLEIAVATGLPVIIHTRAAQADTLALLEGTPGLRGVLHCFTESPEMAERALALGFYISLSGIVTFPKADNVREVAARIPSDRLLIETDAPWLAPVPHRGKQNEPAYLPATAAYLANLRDVSVAELAVQTRANFAQLFNVEVTSVEQRNLR